MSSFKSYRVAHEYTQTNAAPPEKVFPLLCPVREVDWLPGWKHQLIYSDSGVAELGCVFTTPNPPAAGSQESTPSEATWIVTDYDPAAFRIMYVWINPGLIVSELRIQLTPAGDGTTRSHIRFRYTGLSLDGNRELSGYDEEWFQTKMKNWENTINHYLRTGRKMDSPQA
ncbi:MAG TPA: SRPBCC family protein [Terriglobales bacterium]|nr:SRPBCC family protein [Terriglobales bacterium]